jgi:nucleotide-binding universal stress UspA family protein
LTVPSPRAATRTPASASACRLDGDEQVAPPRFGQQTADHRMRVVRIAAAGADVQDDEKVGSGGGLHDGYVCRVRFIRGAASRHDGLLLAAELGADSLVMGCYGHSRIRELVLGGPAARCSNR